jgi:hypothetical protein
MRTRNDKGLTINESTIQLKDGYAPYINFDNQEADIIVLAYQPGFGKTYNAIEYLKDKHNINSFYFTNRHETIKEIIKKWDTKNNPLPTHWMGFEKSCTNKYYKTYASYKISPKKLCSLCKKKLNCEYPKQFKKKDRVFAPIEYLEYLSNYSYLKTLNHLKTIFIDERISKVDSYSINHIRPDQVFQKIIPAPYTNAFVQNVKRRNYKYFTPKRLKSIRINYYKIIDQAVKKHDTKTLESIKGFNPSDFEKFIEWWNIYKSRFPKRDTFGIPYYYYAFDALKANSKLKIVILDASFHKRLFQYFLESYNGEKGFNRNIRVQIYFTNEENKDSIIFHMRPKAWHPKANFTKKQYLEYTITWLPDHLNKIRGIFGEENVGIITFQELAEGSRTLGYNTEYYGNLRSKNVFENTPVLVVLGHFFPSDAELDPQGNPKISDVKRMIDEWFLRDKTTYSLIELKDYYEHSNLNKERWQRLMKRYLGSIYSRRLLDEPGKTQFNPSDKLQIEPVQTIQDYFDDEIYQAIHRNRGLQNKRIIFVYCWIPPYIKQIPGQYQKVFSQPLYRVWNEFDVRDIMKQEEHEFFDDLKNQIGDRELVEKTLDLIDLTNKSDTIIASELGLYNKNLLKKPKIDGSGGPASLYVKVLRDGIYKRDVGRRKIKKSKYKIQ